MVGPEVADRVDFIEVSGATDRIVTDSARSMSPGATRANSEFEIARILDRADDGPLVAVEDEHVAGADLQHVDDAIVIATSSTLFG